MSTAKERPARGEHFFSQLDMRDVEVDGVDLAMELATAPNLTNARGALQGGLIATLIDIVAGRVALQGLPSAESVATSDLTIHYLAPVLDGPAQARATVLRRGSRSVVVSVEVYDVAADRLAAVSTIAFAVLRPRS
ncbi:MAG: hypothetical protein QOE05_2689 [Actinomycetota bacterium]|nr:hypothetical protein [Actinomycetota bacterium]